MDTPTPPSVCGALGNAGPLPVVNWNGLEWRVAFTTPEVLAEVEGEVIASAFRNVQAAERYLPAATYAEFRTATLTAIQARQFAFNQPSFWSVMGGPDGDDILLCASLRVMQPKTTLADARRMRAEAADEVAVALARVTPSFFEAGAATLPLTPTEQLKYAAELTAQWQASRAKVTPSP